MNSIILGEYAYICLFLNILIYRGWLLVFWNTYYSNIILLEFIPKFSCQIFIFIIYFFLLLFSRRVFATHILAYWFYLHQLLLCWWSLFHFTYLIFQSSVIFVWSFLISAFIFSCGLLAVYPMTPLSFLNIFHSSFLKSETLYLIREVI